jgi:uncharacterized protein (TIGR02145 family)
MIYFTACCAFPPFTVIAGKAIKHPSLLSSIFPCSLLLLLTFVGPAPVVLAKANTSSYAGLSDSLNGCNVDGGIVSSPSTLTGLCISNGAGATVQLEVSGNTGLGRYGLVSASNQQVIASNNTGFFDMASYPPGNYLAGHISVESIATLSGVTNVNQLTGCFHISNYLNISSYTVQGGTITPLGTTTLTGGLLSFQVAGNSGPLGRWVLLNESGSQVLLHNASGTFSFDGMNTGTYRVVHIAFGPDFDTANANPQNPQGCVAASNIVFVTVEPASVQCPENLMDIGGNVYPVVQIGNQCWTAKNLNTDFYDNGEMVPLITDNSAWQALGSGQTGAWSYYNNDPLSEVFYGKLYNFYAVTDPRGLCPAGWHVPTDDDYTLLTDFLGGLLDAGGKMKTTGTTGLGGGLWVTPNAGATNESGFSAVPGGYRSSAGQFYSIGTFGSLWTSTATDALVGWYRGLASYNGSVFRSTCDKRDGCTVRCVMD